MGNLIPFGPRDSGARTPTLKISVSTGSNLGHVTNVAWTWATLRDRLQRFDRDSATLEAFKLLPEPVQAVRKRNGFYVGATFKGGLRKTVLMGKRYLLTFDIDNCTQAQFHDLTHGTGAFEELEYVVHSTRKHHPDKPRLRVVIPLAQPISNDRFEPLSRILASKLDPTMLMVDPVSWHAAQIMYWPSACADTETVYYHNRGHWLQPELVLAEHGNWQDWTGLPRSEREVSPHQPATKAKDPLEKRGPVGAFNRVYDIHDCIATFLSDVYKPSEMGGDGRPARYTYVKGSTTNGAVVYDNGTFLYSHHGTDPCCGRLVNAFDLKRIHVFGGLDDSIPEDTPPQRMPSYLALVNALKADEAVSQELLNSRYEADAAAADDAFEAVPAVEGTEWPDPDLDGPGDPSKARKTASAVTPIAEWPDPDLDGPSAPPAEPTPPPKPPKLDREWMKGLDVTGDGYIKSTLPNIVLLLENDRYLKGLFAYDEFVQQEVVTRRLVVPSLGIDIPGPTERNPTCTVQTLHLIACRHILEAPVRKGCAGWGLRVSDRDIKEAHATVASRHRVHPVRDWLNSLPAWDGVPRLARVWIRTCRTPDNLYYRQTAIVWFTAAVARVFEPGCKFDSAPILTGATGIRKSSLVRCIGGRWTGEIDLGFDSAQKFVEASQGFWIIELPELVQFGRAAITHIKATMSRQVDHVRLPYEPRARDFLRQSVMIGTTNEDQYLRDTTGNRRFWPILCGPGQIDIEWMAHNRDQVFAEALANYRLLREEQPKGDLPLFLTGEAAEIALAMQGEAMVDDGSEALSGMIGAFLENEVSEPQAAYGADPGDPGDALMDAPLVKRVMTSISEIREKVLGEKVSAVVDGKARLIGRLMRAMPGWREGLRVRTKRYGRQRTFIRTGEVVE